MFDLLCGHAGVLANRCHFLLHLSIHLHRFLSRQYCARQGGNSSHGDRLPLLPLGIEPLKERLGLGKFSVHTANLILNHSYALSFDVPCLRASLHVLELLVKRRQGLLQFVGCGFVQSAKHTVHLHRRGLHLLDLSIGIAQLLAEFLKRYLITGGSCFSNLLRQVQRMFAQISQSLLCLLPINL